MNSIFLIFCTNIYIPEWWDKYNLSPKWCAYTRTYNKTSFYEILMSTSGQHIPWLQRHGNHANSCAKTQSWSHGRPSKEFTFWVLPSSCPLTKLNPSLRLSTNGRAYFSRMEDHTRLSQDPGSHALWTLTFPDLAVIWHPMTPKPWNQLHLYRHRGRTQWSRMHKDKTSFQPHHFF